MEIRGVYWPTEEEQVPQVVMHKVGAASIDTVKVFYLPESKDEIEARLGDYYPIYRGVRAGVAMVRAFFGEPL